MLYFLVPLRAKATSNNWNVVLECFNNMLYSVLSQTDDSYHLVLVCHEIPPSLTEGIPHVTVISINEPIPELTDLKEQHKDKVKKKKIGLEYINKQNNENSFVMLLDADDMVCNCLAAYVNNNMECAGWYITKGYQFSYGTGKVTLLQEFLLWKRRFDHICGSSIIAKLNEKTTEILLGNHSLMQEKCKQQSLYLKKLPFRGAIYVVDTGSNITLLMQHSVKLIRLLKYIKNRFTYDRLMSIGILFVRNKYKNFPLFPQVIDRRKQAQVK